jgi:hypothetical protein
MQYNRPIDSHGFQFISTASDHENIGIGNLVADVTLAITMESLGAGLIGRQGMGSGGRPLMGMIPGISPAGFEKGAGKSLLESITQRAGDWRSTSTPGYAPWGGSGFNAGLMQTHTNVQRVSLIPGVSLTGKGGEKALLNAYNATAGSHRGLWDTIARPRDIAKMGFGLGLKSLSSAWLINDLFGMGFSAASGAIQGMSTYSYDRRNQETPAEHDLGDGFAQTRASFTQRQTAMAAIHNSQMNTRAAMGNEATFMHA